MLHSPSHDEVTLGWVLYTRDIYILAKDYSEEQLQFVWTHKSYLEVDLLGHLGGLVD